MRQVGQDEADAEEFRLAMQELASGQTAATLPLRNVLIVEEPRQNPIDDLATSIRESGLGAPPNPIICPQCANHTTRGTVQGKSVETGALMGCHCGAVFRVAAGMFGELIDPKTCSVADLKLLDKVRREVKRTRRQWADFQARNRQAALAGEAVPTVMVPKK